MAKKSGMKQIWFVSPIMVERDPNKVEVWPLPQNQPEEVQEARPAPRNRNDLQLEPMQTNTGNDFGYHMARNNVVTLCWNTKKAADEYAKQQAAKNPKTAYGVFSCCDVFETTQPEVIEKMFNEQGELVVRKTVEKSDGQTA